jgi:hypothetical protein
MPCQAGLDRIEVHIRSVHVHLAEEARGPVPLVEHHLNGVSVRQIREALLRYLPERLALLRRVDAGEPPPMLLPLGGQDREGITVGDADDAANQLIGPS